MNHYHTLGVPEDASGEEIREAYRKKAQKDHPDKGGDEEKFKAIVLAKQVLCNPKSRERYDRTGENEVLDVEDQAEANIATLFTNICNDDSINPDTADIMKLMRHTIGENMKKLLTGIEDRKRSAKKFRKALKRLHWKKKSDTPSAIAVMVGRQIDSIEKAIENNREQVEVCTAMLEKVAEYEYDFDAPPPQPAFNVTYTQATGGLRGGF